MASLVIDGLQFARNASELAGEVAGAKLRRLAEMGCSTESLNFRIQGGRNERGKLGLEVLVSGRLQMACQRCLQPLEIRLEQQNSLELAGSLEEIEAAEDDVDRVLATKTMDVAALVEDEAILGLPMIARHEACGAEHGNAVQGRKTERQSPFDALAALKRRN